MVQSAAEVPKIISMKDFLRASLRDAEKMDAKLHQLDSEFHQMRERVFAQLCALEAAEDQELRQEVEELGERLLAEEPRPGTSVEEFRERYGLSE